MMTKYIHYGASEFDPGKFKPIKNKPLVAKPQGGLWGSRINSPLGWDVWCKREEFHIEKLEKSFEFTLAENANVLFLDSSVCLEGLPTVEHELMPTFSAWVCLDFEKLLESGVDAIEITISGDKSRGGYLESLYQKLYTWDCDSILVLNKDVVLFSAPSSP